MGGQSPFALYWIMMMRRLLASLFILLGFCYPLQAQLLLGVSGDNGKAGGTYQGAGDVYSQQADLWYGLRCYKASQASLAKVINIRRASDNATTDVGFTAACKLDTSINTGGGFCVSTTCFIHTWYDISGTTNDCGSVACDLTQTTNSQQPQLVFNCLNTSLPCVQFTSSSFDVLTNATPCGSGCASAQMSMIAVAERTANFTTQGSIFTCGTGGSVSCQMIYGTTANTVFTSQTGTGVTATASDSAAHELVASLTAGVGSVMCADNICGTPGNAGNVGGQSTLFMGNKGSGFYLTGEVAEFGLFFGLTPTTIQQTALCHNAFAYWATATSC